MEDSREEQIEALKTLYEFNQRLLKNMRIVIKELSGERLDDTDNFVKGIIDAMNWEIEVMNGTMSVLNENEVRIEKEEFNRKIIMFEEAVNAKNDYKMAEAIKGLITEFEKLENAVAEIIA